jgi:hypothetical protein
MSNVIPLALSLVQNDLATATAAERDRLSNLRAGVEAYALAREGLVVVEKLARWGLADAAAADAARDSVRTALDSLRGILDVERPAASCTSEPPQSTPVIAAAPDDARPSGLELEDCEEATFTILELPNLKAGHGAIVIFGGEKRPGGLEAASTLVGRKVEWASTREANQLERAVKRGRIGAVVILEGFIGHVACAQIRAACRQRQIPTAFGHRGGTVCLRHALVELDSKCATAAAAE